MSPIRSASLIILASLICNASIAQVPDFISFQGRITDPSGIAGDTLVDITTKLYQGGSEIFTQAHTSVVVDSGVFNVDIGPLGNVVFDQPTDLGVTVGGNSEMVPRTPLRSVPYSHGLKLPFEGSGTAGVNSGLISLKTTGGGAAVQVDSSAGPGITVEYSATSGIEILVAGQNGVRVDSAQHNGLLIADAGLNGVRITSPTQDGIRIENAGDDGIDIRASNGDGLFIGLVGSPPDGNFSAGSDGIEIVGAANNGLFIGYAFRGIRIANAGLEGLRVDRAIGVGFRIDTTFSDGVSVGWSRNHGIRVG